MRDFADRLLGVWPGRPDFAAAQKIRKRREIALRIGRSFEALGGLALDPDQNFNQITLSFVGLPHHFVEVSG